jgi:clan AA aspartic protease
MNRARGSIPYWSQCEVNGTVDEQARSLHEASVSSTMDGETRSVSTWIDTAFDGHLVFSASLIEDIGLEPLVETEAILADGSKVALETFICVVEWFGQQIPVQVIANEGKLPLLGTGLLDGHVLHVDYVSKSLTLN